MSNRPLVIEIDRLVLDGVDLGNMDPESFRQDLGREIERRLGAVEGKATANISEKRSPLVGSVADRVVHVIRREVR